jgi:diguanylate cyclase (GGDEF)-like protein
MPVDLLAEPRDLLSDSPRDLLAAPESATWSDTLSAAPTVFKEGVRLGAGGVARALGDAAVSDRLIDTLAPMPPQRLVPLDVSPGVTPIQLLNPNADRDRASARRAQILDSGKFAGPVRRAGLEMTDKARLNLKDATPENLTFWQDATLNATQSLGMSLPGLAASVATRSPTPALASMFAGEFGSSYDEALRSGKDRDQAARYASVNATIEVITERVPLGTLLKQGTPLFTRLLKLYGQELIGENIATVLQDANEFSMKNPDATMEQWVNDYGGKRLERAAQTSASTLIATTIQGSAVHGANRAIEKLSEPRDLLAPPDAVEVAATEPRDLLSDVEAAPVDPAVPQEPADVTETQPTPTADPYIEFKSERSKDPKYSGRIQSAAFADDQSAARREIEAVDKEIRAEWESQQRSAIVPPISQGAPVDRRTDQDTRKRVADMSIEEARQALLTHELTGIPNKRAYQDAPKQPVQVAIDVDSLKWVNDNMGHESGDTLLRSVAQAIREETQEAYHLSGDEFATQAQTNEEADAVIRRVNDRLNRATIEYTAPDGTVHRFTGLGVSHGKGNDLKAADVELQRSKSERESGGQRAARGQQPPGVVRIPATGRQDNESRSPATPVTEPETPADAGVSASGVSAMRTSASKDASAMAGRNYTGLLSEKALPESSKSEKPIRREDIIRPLMKALKTSLYQGRVKGKDRLGFFRHVVEEVRIKNRNDLEVTAHEVAHLLDDRYPMFKKAYQRAEFRNEVRGVSYDAMKLHEGFAEFMRLYLTQETEAAQRAPKFYDWFTNAIKSHEVGPLLRETQTKMHSWYSQGALNRAKSKFGGPDVPLRQQFDELVDGWQEKTVEKIFDALHGIKVAELQLAGEIQDATQSPYKSMRLVAGSRGVIQTVFRHGTINWDASGNIVFTGKGLEQILQPVSDRLDKVELYFAGRRAQELAGQGRENLFRPDEIKAMLQVGENDPAIRKAFTEWLAFSKRMMDFYQGSGILSADARKSMEEMNKNYVPFHRVYEEVTGETVAKRGAGFMRLKGGTGNVNDILDNIAHSVSMLVHASVLNKAKQKVYAMIDGPGGARFAAKIPTEAKAAKVDTEQLKDKFLRATAGVGLTEYQRLSKAGKGSPAIDKMLSMLDEGLGETLTFFTFGQAPTGANVDSVMRNGKLDFYEVADPMFLNAMQSFGAKPVGLAMRVLNGFKNTLTRTVTTVPDFQIPNLLRDTFMAFTLSKSGFRPIVDSLKGMRSRITRDKAYWEFLANGGGFASTVHGETMRRNLERIYTKSGISYKTVLDTPSKLLNALDEFNSAFEYGTRLEEFKRLREQGASPRESAFAGREISTDFAMRGSSDFVRFFALTVPFFNARLQGLYRLGRGFGHKERKALVIKGLIGITLPALALYWMNKDDERYQALPDWVKDLHWVIFLAGKDTPLLIPKPFEVGLIFGTAPERLAESIEKRDGKKLADVMLWNISEALSLNPTPQIVRPLLDISRNKNFSGAPIVPEDLLDVEGFEQYRPWTSETLVKLGKHTGLSPLKTESILRGYLGSIGMYALMVTDSMVEHSGGEEPDMRLDEMPVVRRFFKTAPYKNTSYENDFYELAEESRKSVATFRKIVRENRESDAEKYIGDADKAVAIGIGKTLERIRSEVADINRQMRMVRTDTSLNGADKRKSLDELQQARNELFKEASGSLNAKELREFREKVVGQN